MLRKTLLFSATFFVLIFTSCTKETDSLGLGVLPADDLLAANATDTFTLFTSTVAEDSIRTDEITRGIHLLGTINDPYFGTTEASLSMQFLLTGAITLDPSQLDLDSIVLSFEYTGYFGDQGSKGPAQPQTFHVYELNHSLYYDSIYYSDYQPSYNTEPVGKTVHYQLNTTDSIITEKGKQPASMRIRLTQAFGEKILNAFNTTSVASNENFLHFLKGLHVKPVSNFNTGDGAILGVNLSTINSGLTVYYTNSTTGISGYYTFHIPTGAARVNSFKHSYSGTPAGNEIAQPDPAMQRMYVQGMGGTKARIEIPGLNELKNIPDLVINKAELVIPAAPEMIGVSGKAPLPRMILVAAGDDNDNLVIRDFEESETYIGGYFDPQKNEYRFNLGREINLIANGIRENNGFYLLPAANAVTPEHAILFGAGASNNKPKLIVYFTNY